MEQRRVEELRRVEVRRAKATRMAKEEIEALLASLRAHQDAASSDTVKKEAWYAMGRNLLHRTTEEERDASWESQNALCLEFQRGFAHAETRPLRDDEKDEMDQLVKELGRHVVMLVDAQRRRDGEAAPHSAGLTDAKMKGGESEGGEGSSACVMCEDPEVEPHSLRRHCSNPICRGFGCQPCVDKWISQKYDKSLVICPSCSSPGFGVSKGSGHTPAQDAEQDPNSLRAHLETLRIPHWLFDDEIRFLQTVITTYAAALNRSNADQESPRPIQVLRPANPVYNFEAMGAGRRDKHSCETTIYRTGDFEREEFQARYLQYNIQLVNGNHWVGTVNSFDEGAPTDCASRVVGIDSLPATTKRAPLLRKTHAQMAKRGGLLSSTCTEPPGELDLMVGVPLVTTQGDGVSCGALQLAWYFLTATQTCDPFLPDQHGRSISRFDLPCGQPMYDWLAQVVEWLGMDG